jgi:hypothetical protein
MISAKIGLRQAIDEGLSVMQFHDIFTYMEYVLHFADVTREDKDFDEVFGSVDFQADVLMPEFFAKF